MLLDRVAEVILLGREDVGLTQSGLARAAAMQQPTISAYESGKKLPRAESFERIRSAVRLRPSIPLAVYADRIREAAARHRLTSVRVFGSAVRGTDTERSDIDLLVSLTDGAGLFDLGAFADEVERITGFPVDVMTDDDAQDAFSPALASAVPL